LSWGDPTQAIKIRNKLPYHFLVRTEKQSIAAANDTQTPEGESIAEANDTVTTQYLPIDSDSQTPEGESKKWASFIPDCFPQTQKLFEQLVDGSLSLDESSTGGILPMLYAADSEPFLSSQNGDGQTLAHLAARYGCRSLWEDLRDSGINFDVTDQHGKKPRDYVQFEGTSSRFL
jgi:hypothetical protein